jgi:SOS-response transcriptional repressor LexA
MLFTVPQWQCRDGNEEFQNRRRTFTLKWETGDPLCWYFWGRAGLSKEDLLRVMPRLRERLHQAQMPHLEIVRAGGGAKKAEGLQLVTIPLLKTVAASHGEKCESLGLLHDGAVESMIAAPKDWCPNPSTTSCLRVRGSSMSPLIHDGYILAVDSAQTEIAELNGKVVIAWHRDKGLTVSRLKQFDHTIVLHGERQLRVDNPEQQAEMENRSQGALVDWKIAVNSLVVYRV